MRTLLTTLTLLTLAGCGGGSSSGNNSSTNAGSNTGSGLAQDGDVQNDGGELQVGDRQGSLFFEVWSDAKVPGFGQVYPSASFFELVEILPNTGGDETNAPLVDERMADCKISVTLRNAPSSGGNRYRYRNISAGEVIPLSANGTSIGNFIRESNSTNTEPGLEAPANNYTIETELAYPMAQGTQAAIPGDEFAAFESVDVPYVGIIPVVSPSAESDIGVDGMVRWNPEFDAAPSTVRIEFDSHFEGSERVYVECETPNSGTFVLPEPVRQRIAPYIDDQYPNSVAVGTWLTNTVREANDVLFVEVYSYTSWYR